ncbi:MAG: calcium/proton exchanger [Deltaproteobacteria bacterium]|nr:calcium/proton exchanger [Deltaproteobacteria bacterium]
MRIEYLLAFIPVAVAADWFAPQRRGAAFAAAAAAIVPLAAELGKTTGRLAEKTGVAIGGLLNVTFGNAAEMIIGLTALRSGLGDVVKASITGAIIGNLLLVLGAALLTGGLRYPTQTFNAAAARSRTTMLLLAATALIAPAAYHYLAGGHGATREHGFSVEVSIVLVVSYALGLLFSLRTHRELFAGHTADAGAVEEPGEASADQYWLLAVLAMVTVVIAWMSEILVGCIQPVARQLGMTQVFIGVIVVAMVGNSAEQSSAIVMATKDRMDLALSIAVGSSIQIALFVAPVLVLASYIIAPAPINLVLTPAEVLAVTFSVVIAGQICGDGESNWFEGAQLLAVYAIVALLFYFLPAG